MAKAIQKVSRSVANDEQEVCVDSQQVERVESHQVTYRKNKKGFNSNDKKVLTLQSKEIVCLWRSSNVKIVEASLDSGKLSNRSFLLPLSVLYCVATENVRVSAVRDLIRQYKMLTIIMSWTCNRFA